MAAVVQCPGCSKIVGHSVAEEAASSSSLLQVQVCRGLELSAQLYDDPRRREEGPCRKAQCAACKTPLGKVLVDSDVLVVSRGDVHVYEIPRIASSLEDEHGRPSRTARSLKRKRTTASAPTSPTLPTDGLKHALAPEMPGRADIRDLVRREVANARARWAADLATEKSMESLVKELVNDEMAKVKFALLALNNRMNTLVDELAFEEEGEEEDEDDDDDGDNEGNGQPAQLASAEPESGEDSPRSALRNQTSKVAHHRHRSGVRGNRRGRHIDGEVDEEEQEEQESASHRKSSLKRSNRTPNKASRRGQRISDPGEDESADEERFLGKDEDDVDSDVRAMEEDSDYN